MGDHKDHDDCHDHEDADNDKNDEEAMKDDSKKEEGSAAKSRITRNAGRHFRTKTRSRGRRDSGDNDDYTEDNDEEEIKDVRKEVDDSPAKSRITRNAGRHFRTKTLSRGRRNAGRHFRIKTRSR